MSVLKLADLPTVWQGGVNQWECDQMGHMNTQFYFHRLAEGIGHFAGLIGMPGALSPDSKVTLNCHRQNARFIREARIPSPLKMKMGVVSISHEELTAFAALLSAEDGTVMASFLCRINPAITATNEATVFSDATLELAQQYNCLPEERFLPRSFEAGDPARVDLPDLDAENFHLIASGSFLASSCDGLGKMRIDQPVSRLSDGMTVLTAEIRHIVVEHAANPVTRVGGAMLEAKFDILKWAKLGDAFELWSKIAHAGPKLVQVESWLINPHTQTPFVLLKTASVVFDLDARAIISVSENAAGELQKVGIPASF